MKHHAILILALAVLGFASPQTARADNLSGFYVSGGVGGGSITHELSVPAFGNINFDGLGGEGFLGTVGIGYDKQRDNLIFGVFADFDFTSIESELSAFGASVDLPVDYVINVGLRIGFETTPDTMLFVSGGYSHLSMGDLEFGGATIFEPGDFDGFFIGGGMESRLSQNLFGRVEYRYSDYGGNDYFGGILEIEPSTHVGRFTVSYKFNRNPIPDAEPLK